MNVTAQPTVTLRKPWSLRSQGLALFEGDPQVPRLSHYFLPGLIRKGRHILFLDGANSADPHLMARLAARRGIPFEEFTRYIQIARAFTCFQLTELIVRVPRFIEVFPADVLIVTALPELYFDQDIRDWDARIAFEQALRYLRRWANRTAPPLAVAVFTSSAGFAPPLARKTFLTQARTAAHELWKFEAGAEGKLALVEQSLPCEQRAPQPLVGTSIRNPTR